VSARQYTRIGGYIVPLEQPPAAPRYEWHHVLSAAFGGALLAILAVAALVRGV
jgi:hypothetical protein